MNQKSQPRDQVSEAHYWLDIAKRILAGDIRPEEARHILKLGSHYCENAEAEDGQAALSAAGQ
jgi:hypothetical protein